MESEILKVAEYAIEQPGVTGYICVDSDGLCVAGSNLEICEKLAKGQASQSLSGIVHQLANLASKIEEPSPASESKEPPVIRVDLERLKVTIQSRDSYTTALISPQK